MNRSLILSLILSMVFMIACTPSNNKIDVIAYESGKPYTRWWWFASEPDTLDIKHQLEWLRGQGFGGVEIAWIYPMHGDSTVHRVKWLSPEWSEAVVYAKKTADALVWVAIIHMVRFGHLARSDCLTRMVVEGFMIVFLRLIVH